MCARTRCLTVGRTSRIHPAALVAGAGAGLRARRAQRRRRLAPIVWHFRRGQPAARRCGRRARPPHAAAGRGIAAGEAQPGFSCSARVRRAQRRARRRRPLVKKSRSCCLCTLRALAFKSSHDLINAACRAFSIRGGGATSSLRVNWYCSTKMRSNTDITGSSSAYFNGL